MLYRKAPCKRCISLIRCKIKVTNISENESISFLSCRSILSCQILESYIEHSIYTFEHIEVNLKKVYKEIQKD